MPHPRYRNSSGPSYSWTDSEQDIVCPPYDPILLKSAVVNIASLSTGVEDCSFLLDILGIDIKEVWS